MSDSEGVKHWKERRMEKRMKTCRHFKGLMNDKACALGVDLATVRDTSKRPYGLPCVGDCVERCAKHSPYTREEVEAENLAFAESARRVGVARAAIVASKLQSGAIDCPCCKRPKSLRFTVSSYNGHIHAGCPGCVSWME